MKVKKDQSLLSRIPESMRIDKFHRILIQWSDEYCKGVNSLNNLLQKYTGAITAFTKVSDLGSFDRRDDTWTILWRLYEFNAYENNNAHNSVMLPFFWNYSFPLLWKQPDTLGSLPSAPSSSGWSLFQDKISGSSALLPSSLCSQELSELKQVLWSSTNFSLLHG